MCSKKVQLDGERSLGLKLQIGPSNAKVIRGLIGRHATDDRGVEFPIVSFEGTIFPDPQQLSGEKAVEVTIGRQLVVLASGD